MILFVQWLVAFNGEFYCLVSLQCLLSKCLYEDMYIYLVTLDDYELISSFLLFFFQLSLSFSLFKFSIVDSLRRTIIVTPRSTCKRLGMGFPWFYFDIQIRDPSIFDGRNATAKVLHYLFQVQDILYLIQSSEFAFAAARCQMQLCLCSIKEVGVSTLGIAPCMFIANKKILLGKDLNRCPGIIDYYLGGDISLNGNFPSFKSLLSKSGTHESA